MKMYIFRVLNLQLYGQSFIFYYKSILGDQAQKCKIKRHFTIIVYRYIVHGPYL